MRYLLALLLLLCACSANVAYRRTVVQQPHDHFYIKLRQPGRQNAQVLAQSLKREALWQCETFWFRSVWIRALRVWYSPITNETLGGVAFYCYGSKNSLR